MIVTSTNVERPGTASSRSDRFGLILRDFYEGLKEQGIPEHMAALVRQLSGETPRPGDDGRKLALVVEADDGSRALAAVLLEESGLAVVECASAEAALAVMQHRSPDVVFIFADEDLSGQRDGRTLAQSVGTLWPQVRFVLTTREGSPDPEDPLPGSVIRLPKPWRGLDVLIEAERVLSRLGQPPARLPS